MLKINSLNLSFGGLKATNDVSMHIRPDHISALIGPNGAGKTTLFNLITGVYEPDSGEIWFDGKRIDGKKPHEVNKAGIARTYQVINLFDNMTVLENVLVGMHSRLKSSFMDNIFQLPRMKREEKNAVDEAKELLEFVGLYENKDDLAGSLSYGNQRLLEIIRGMASKPKLILLDEPAAGMNSSEKEDLNILIRRIAEREITVLVVEHDMKLVMNIADEVFVINSGANLASGSPEEVQKNPQVIEAYLGGDD